MPQAAWIQRGETQEGRASPATTMRKGLLALGSPELLEKVRVELEGGGEVVGEVGGVVAAGVEVEFVGDVARGEDFVEGGGAGLRNRSRLGRRNRNKFSGRRDLRCGPGVRGLFWSQKAGSSGLPKTPPRTRARGDGRMEPRKLGSFSMSAALWALTEAKSCGWRKARWRAP